MCYFHPWTNFEGVGVDWSKWKPRGATNSKYTKGGCLFVATQKRKIRSTQALRGDKMNPMKKLIVIIVVANNITSKHIRGTTERENQKVTATQTAAINKVAIHCINRLLTKGLWQVWTLSHGPIPSFYKTKNTGIADLDAFSHDKHHSVQIFIVLFQDVVMPSSDFCLGLLLFQKL